MPLYEFTCAVCGGKTEEHIFRSYEAAQAEAATWEHCGQPMAVDFPVVSFTQFKPFVTEAFNKAPGQAPIEVSDRAQLRNLLRSRRMVEMGDSSSYFGSNPKSVPTWEEICKHGKSGGDPKLAKLVQTAEPEKYTAVEKQCQRTDFGRRSVQKGENVLAHGHLS